LENNDKRGFFDLVLCLSDQPLDYFRRLGSGVLALSIKRKPISDLRRIIYRPKFCAVRFLHTKAHDGAFFPQSRVLTSGSVRGRARGEEMKNRRDRVHELCMQIRSENDPKQLDSEISEINDILGSIISEVDWTMRSLTLRRASQPARRYH
jgi:hypothetical protein